jgi:hypothetical protein
MERSVSRSTRDAVVGSARARAIISAHDKSVADLNSAGMNDTDADADDIDDNERWCFLISHTNGVKMYFNFFYTFL